MTKWNLIECATASIVQVDGNDVIFTYDEEPERWKRIARQFYATPDLLEACEEAYYRLNQYKYRAMRPTVAKLDAAIAKAKGEVT